MLILLSLASLLSLTLADVLISSPAGGAKVSAGSPITVQWADGNGKTPLADLAGYQIMLVAGGSTDTTSVCLPQMRGQLVP